MYIIPNAKNMQDVSISQIRCVLQGGSNTGKTTGGLTFPNLVVADIDNNLVGHQHRKDIQVLPFRNTEWVKSWFKTATKYPIRDAYKFWLQNEGMKLEPGQTLFTDSWSTLQDNFDRQQELEPKMTTTGGEDAYYFWKKKIEYAEEICNLYQELRCHVVVSMHEQGTYDHLGKLMGKVEPLMAGKFGKKMGLYFTDWFRCVVKSKKDAAGKPTDESEYFWQTKGDDMVDLKTRMRGCAKFVEPTFASFKY